ncbi:MAG: UDP-N-acetylmuramoyl-L-alanyl-D-glutamate--2,6-diaminopimelate ligase [Candidatus Omnitrophica bacterium]|nr:UDP-N-acetylmuramoyl-L-alanyl-D-glutamate--2,6-diaminopimelate ligase [Candidatus Omnitrophota bacterium]
MKLQQLTKKLTLLDKWNWNPTLEINGVTSDSRCVKPGNIFVAWVGPHTDGHLYIEEAVKRGATVCVGEKEPSSPLLEGAVFLRVSDSRETLAHFLNEIHGSPSKKLKLIGVTGTNGKTTIAYLMNYLLGSKIRSGYIGTLGFQTPNRFGPLSNTTPGIEELFQLLREMKEEGIRAVAMEVSSHALHQRRVEGLEFELALFTQLTPEHLDYHPNLEEYFQSKRLLFSKPPQPKKMLINRDSPYGKRLLAENPKAKSFSITDDANYRARDIETSFEGSQFVFEKGKSKFKIKTQLPFIHNVSNVTSVLAALDLLGYDLKDFIEGLRVFSGVPGRMERVDGNGFSVFVDYAHTPDAFENILSEARRLRPKRILTLFGCGGDRDPFKRPKMTKIAYHYSDYVILTSDNPRTEDPLEIIRQMRHGLPSDSLLPNVIEIPDRREAIGELLTLAEPGDALFILGKGHEDYQVLGTEKIHFDDREIVTEILSNKRRSRIAV